MGLDVCMQLSAIVPPDDKYKKMRDIYDACTKGNVDLPKEVDDYFQEYEPTDDGLEIYLESVEIQATSDGRFYQIIELDLSSVPKNATKIRANLG